VIRVTAERLREADERLGRTRRDLPRAAVVLLARQWASLDGARRGVVHGARRDIAAARRSQDELRRALAARARQRLTHESERADARGRRLALVDPRRVIERGYALLRLADGTVLTRATAAPVGSAVVADLREGRLRLRSEGDEA
jgi:exodeoxyribonuclease VII large subunit